MNNLAQIASCPYEKDKDLILKFQTVRVSEMTSALDALDICQLLKLLHVYMTFFKKPLASKKLLISWLDLYSLERNVDAGTPKTAYKVELSIVINIRRDTITGLALFDLLPLQRPKLSDSREL